MIGSLMYLMNTGPTICFVVNTLNQYMVDSRRFHLIVTNHLLMYLKATIEYGRPYICERSEDIPVGIC